MAWEPEFLDLMPDTVQIALVTSRDAYGKRSYGTAVTYPALVQEAQRRVLAPDGRETLSTHVLWVAPHASSGLPALAPDALVTLADGSTHGILSYQLKHDEQGDHHLVVFLGR